MRRRIFPCHPCRHFFFFFTSVARPRPRERKTALQLQDTTKTCNIRVGLPSSPPPSPPQPRQYPSADHETARRDARCPHPSPLIGPFHSSTLDLLLLLLLPLGTRDDDGARGTRTALIILNQPFSEPLLRRLWHASDWRCCADGGANRLHDLLLLSGSDDDDDDNNNNNDPDPRGRANTNGDLDSVRESVRRYYETRGVPVVQDDDLDTTDLMKCVRSLQEKEMADGLDVGGPPPRLHRAFLDAYVFTPPFPFSPQTAPHDLVLLGGLSGRLDQTVHTLSFLHKLRNSGRRIFAVTDENVGWGKHRISIDHSILGPTCGLLPVGVDSTVLTTTGLRWNLTGQTSGFDGLMSTSNHLVPGEDTVFIETSRPIWWVAELRMEGIR
ncbi:thiamine pyrophosphokinase Thi80 [Russula earlei]|uniref:Thiamine pyrophosphokinase Thi80 n=1 Tax=Russula earlei TaxID=71964 RepID=A0ACC0ULV4_9AGAM|nr:thiamine pyrophosphokinase Thi80 [Russula earlei]